MSACAAAVPGIISRRLEVYKLRRRIRRFASPKLSALPSAIETSADRARLRALWTEVADAYHREPTSAAKYAKPAEWLLLNTLRAGELGLHHAAGLRILDIGCGPAYFLAAARLLGHQAEGVDAPSSVLTPVERRVYGELIEALHCGPYVSPLLIDRFVPLPFPGERYDLITAFWICFNNHRRPDEWGRAEWCFFVEDAVTHLRRGGRLFLELNENPERYGDLRFYDPPTLDYFHSVGAVDRGRVLVTRS